MKPLQADWLIKWCTQLMDPEAQRIVPSVWGETGITKAELVSENTKNREDNPDFKSEIDLE